MPEARLLVRGVAASQSESFSAVPVGDGAKIPSGASVLAKDRSTDADMIAGACSDAPTKERRAVSGVSDRPADRPSQMCGRLRRLGHGSACLEWRSQSQPHPGTRRNAARDCGFLALPQVLKQNVASYLSVRDVRYVSMTCKAMAEDLDVSAVHMKIAFKSWYGTGDSAASETQESTVRTVHDHPGRLPPAARSEPRAGDFAHVRCGPKIPHLRGRTHSILLVGSWKLNAQPFVRQGEFFVVAHPVTACIGSRRYLPFDGGRVLWASPVENIPRIASDGCLSNGTPWIRIPICFHPNHDEDYYLYVKTGPDQPMLAESLQVNNLTAKLIVYDSPTHELAKHYNELVRHMSNVENRSAFYARMLQAVTRSIRIQLTRKYDPSFLPSATSANDSNRCTDTITATTPHTSIGHRTSTTQNAHLGDRCDCPFDAISGHVAAEPANDPWTNAVDPFLEQFFRSTKIERDSNTLQMLEEIAGFLSEYAYDSRSSLRNRSFGIGNDSQAAEPWCVPASGPLDWVPYAASNSSAFTAGSKVGDAVIGDAEPISSDIPTSGMVAERWLSAMRQQQTQSQSRLQHNSPAHRPTESRSYHSHRPDIVSAESATSRNPRSSNEHRGRKFLHKVLSGFGRPNRNRARQQSQPSQRYPQKRRPSDATEAMSSSCSWLVDR